MITEEEKKPQTEDPKLETSNDMKKKRRTQPVVIYLSILTVVVVAMLILSYAMQRRNTQHLEDLNETVQSSYDAMVTINDLQGQVNTLNAQLAQYDDQVESLEDQLEQAQAEAEAAAEAYSTSEEKLNSTISALNYLLLLEQYYQKEDYATCTAIINSMEAAGCADALAGYEWSSSVAQGKSAKDYYAELKTAVETHAAGETAAPTATPTE